MANCNLDQCVSSALSSLPKSALKAIDAAVVGAMAGVTASIGVYTLKSAQLNLWLGAVQAKVSAYETIVGNKVSGFNLIPSNVVALCNDLGRLNQAIDDTVSMELAEIEEQLFHINALNASLVETGALIAEANDLNNFLDCVHTTLQGLMAA